MARQLRCRDVGFDCDEVVTGETDDEVMQKGGQHGLQVHGLKESEMTPEMREKARSLIHDV